MLRALSLFLVVAGVVVGAFGLFQATTAHQAKIVTHPGVAPGTFSVYLPRGAWSAYEQAGTDSTVTNFNATVTAPDGKALAISSALADTAQTFKKNGVAYKAIIDAPIPAAGVYRFHLTIPNSNRRYSVLVSPSKVPKPFPWVGIAVDGLTLLLVGAGLGVLDTHRRRHAEPALPSVSSAPSTLATR